MKKILWIIIALLVVVGLGFGLWGYMKAQGAKKDGQEIKEITSGTLDIESIKPGQREISLTPWKTLAEKSPSILSELDKNTVAPDSLKTKAAEYYSAKAKDKYVEAQYLQELLAGQSAMNLKSTNAKSKTEIETTLSTLEKMQNDINQKNLSLGPEFDNTSKSTQQETQNFKRLATDLSSKMTSSSAPIQLGTANLDKSMDDLIMEIINSLNKWVDLRDQISDEVNSIASVFWLNPLW